MSSPSLAEKAIDVLTLEAVCDLLDVSSRTIHRWRRQKANPLPAHRQGRHVFFLRRELLTWITNQPDQLTSESSVPSQKARGFRGEGEGRHVL